MYILFDFFASAWGVIRSFLLFIDSVGLTFIDNAYNLLVSAAAGFEGDVVKGIAENIARNVYIIIGIFALFRIAVILINTIINPDKLTDKESGFGNVLARFVITICLFVAVPFVFDISREIQAEIMKNNYISKAIIGSDLTSGNPGQVLKDTAVRALIHPDTRVANKNSDNTYTCINDNDPCKTAVESWNNDASITTLTRFIGDYEENGDENIYIYDYIPFVTLLVGGFMTYVLFSFAIDIAVRSVELLALEVLAPLFIVTYIDPKSSSNGPFKNWVKTCSKTFISLFIKIGIVCLMLLFMQNLSTLMKSTNSDNGAFLNLLMMIAVLIFAKKAPKWIGDMIGVEGAASGLWSPKKLRENMAGYGAMKTAGAVGTAYAANRLANRQHNKAAKKAVKKAISDKENELGRALTRKEKRGIKNEKGATYAQKALRNASGRKDAIVQGIKTGQESKNIFSSIKDGVKLSADFKNANAIGEKGLVSKGIDAVQGKVRGIKRYAWGSGKDIQEREKAIKDQESFEKYYTAEARNGMTYKNSPVKQSAFDAEYMGLGNEDGFYAAEAIKREFMKNGAKDIKVSIGADGVPTVTAQKPDGTMVSQEAGKNNPNYSNYVDQGRSLVTKDGADFISDAFKGMQEKAIGNIISANQNIASLMSAKSEASAQAQQSAKALTDALATAGISFDITGKSAAKISNGISEELAKSGKSLSPELEGMIKNYGNDLFNLDNISGQMEQYANSLKSSQSAINALIESNPEKYGNKTFDELLVIIQHEKEDTSKVLKGSSSSEDNSGK